MPYRDKERQRSYQREWMARRRREWLAENGPCVDCGSTTDLEVDHVDASQKVSHVVWSWSEPRRLAELAKCVVRCQGCHQRKTRECHEYAWGSRAASAKLSEQQVVEIRRLRAGGATYHGLGDRFGVNKTTIRRACIGSSWRHLAGSVPDQRSGEAAIPTGS